MRTIPLSMTLAILIGGFSAKAIYASDMPDAIGGYSVLAVLTDTATVGAMAPPRAGGASRVNPVPMVRQPCMMPGEKRVVLQSPQPTIEDALADFSRERIQQELQALNLTEYAQWGLTIVGPGVTRQQIVKHTKQLYRFSKAHSCITLGPPRVTSPVPPGAEKKALPSEQTNHVIAEDSCASEPVVDGERRCPQPVPGRTIIQNGDITVPNTTYMAQSVYLAAPTVGNNQDACSDFFGNENIHCYSAFLNNVLTDKDYFLQAGLAFRGPDYRPLGNLFAIGKVVWTDTAHETTAQPFNIAYHTGHTYWTTITSSDNGTWWMCALDTVDSATYECNNTNNTTDIGRYLKKDPNTSIWAENLNKKDDWDQGFSPEWAAYGATAYIVGLPHEWKSQEVTTAHSCSGKWPPGDAIVGSLVDGAEARFKTSGLPLYCEGSIAR